MEEGTVLLWSTQSPSVLTHSAHCGGGHSLESAFDAGSVLVSAVVSPGCRVLVAKKSLETKSLSS